MMTQSEFEKRVARETGLSQAQIKGVFGVAETILGNQLLDGDDVRTRFGKFKVVNKPARNYRSPASGEMQTTPARRVVKFLPSAYLRDLA